MNSEIVRIELNLPPPPSTPPPSLSLENNNNNNNHHDDGKIVEGILKRPSYRKSVNLDADNASITSSAAAHINCISTNHYERLIEELKCPGCANPMKAPIKLCCTGHSICDGCTNLLDSCPLCKEPFTNIRSLTIEAISSKAFFRCHNASAGCPVRLQTELLGWHEKQCAYKTMKCFMGRVWGECNWVGREVLWKEHLETSHSDKKIDGGFAELSWKLNEPKKSIAGYYVFDVHDEMFNFYQINDKDRLLFTMACTSTTRDKKLNYSYDVEIYCPEDETFVIRHRYPCHSEYDKDILQDGTCVSIPINETARFVTNDRILHFRVIVNKVSKRPKSLAIEPKYPKTIPINFQQTQIEGVNLKSVPLVNIVTRKNSPESPVEEETINEEKPFKVEERSKSEEPRRSNEEPTSDFKSLTSRSSLDLGDDPELEAFIKERWGTPQLNFSRKFLQTSAESSPSSSSKLSSNGSNSVSLRDEEYLAVMEKNYEATHGKDGKLSVKRVKKGIRKSLRNLKNEFYEITSHKKAPSNAGTPTEEKPKNIKAKRL